MFVLLRTFCRALYCGQRLPPGQHPRQDVWEQGDFSNWLAGYDQACQSKATCKLVATLGDRVDEEIRPILDLHDSATRASSELPLA
jgi:hypothetical protein